MFRKQIFLTIVLLVNFSIIAHVQAGNKYITENLSPKVLNSKPISTKEIDEWITKVDENFETYRKVTKDVFGQSTEGGAVTGYFNGSMLIKISAEFFGETGKVITLYYLREGKLCFVLKEEQLYDRPIYDGEPKIVEKKLNKYYIAKENIMQWIDENHKLVKDDGKNYSVEINHFLNDIEEFRHLLSEQKE
jgi:hypothetical protein